MSIEFLNPNVFSIARSEPDADLLMLKVFMQQTIIELARWRSDPEEFVGRFMDRMKSEVDWKETRARDEGDPDSPAFEKVRTRIEFIRSYVAERAKGAPS